jgi:hypothetical protein
MRRFFLPLAFVACAALGAPLETPAVRGARENLQQARQLLAAGAIARQQVDQAEQDLQTAIDDATLKTSLFGELTVSDLTEEQAIEMKAAASRALDRQEQRLAAAQRLVTEGVASRSTLIPFDEEIGRAKHTVELANERAALIEELSAIVHAEQEVTETPSESLTQQQPFRISVRYEGSGQFTTGDFKQLVLAYEKHFDKKLPVSARGETALHRSLSFDHKGRVDVALSPDQDEGVWLTQYLEKAHIPYFAFRYRVPGKATAPHIHIGPPSVRLRSAD